jgi:outer membrane protein TolC
MVVVLSGLLVSAAQDTPDAQDASDVAVQENVGLTELMSGLKAPLSVNSLKAQADVYDAQQSELDIQRRELDRQFIALDAQEKSISIQEGLIPLQIHQENYAARYQLQTAYYNVCLLIENDVQLARQLELMDKQIEVEATKLSLGMSTQNAVDLLRSSREAISQSRAANQAQIDYEKSAVSLKVSASESRPVIFSIPDTIGGGSTYQLEDLQERLVANNLNIKEQEAAASAYHETENSLKNLLGSGNAYYLEAAAQYNLAIAQRDDYKSQLLLYANGKYSAYAKAEAQYQAAIASRASLLDQLEIFDNMYTKGEISELECLASQYEVHKSLLEIKTAVVAKANSLMELDLTANGIVLS